MNTKLVENMDFEVVEKVDNLHSRSGFYHQMVLPTAFVLRSANKIEPHHFNIMRWVDTDFYYYEKTKQLHSYEELCEIMQSAGNFQGTAHYRNAVDAELWLDQGDDGHIEWIHRGNYRILFNVTNHYRYFEHWDGEYFSYVLADKVREFEGKL